MRRLFYRVPALVRWPGLAKPHAEINDIVSARRVRRRARAQKSRRECRLRSAR
jgi:hypothetical protein